MREDALKHILRQVRHKELSLSAALDLLKTFPVADIGCAKIDSHRYLRRGFPEVVFCRGKTLTQLERIARHFLSARTPLLMTKASPEAARHLRALFPRLYYHEDAGILYTRPPARRKKDRPITVVCAGTSDIPIAEEARLTAEMMGQTVITVYDVGVAGVHRLLPHLSAIRRSAVVIVVAGMEGALPSIVSGLIDRPVIAVPTSVGYGTNLAGLTPLFAMLNSCSPGIAVVNIDNGFGAGYLAGLINDSRTHRVL